ncbi:MAG: hypothetical protein LBH28_05635, partial [Oscillospiraceae bacterium]|nr:hypothetical protein [Oscillospiraceae bacterium]
IVNADDSSKFYPERHKCLEKETIPDVKDELEAQGTEYTLDVAAVEFGQSLRTRREAVAFVLRNAPEAADKEASGFVEENLVSTGRDDFPFYLPKRKEIGIFIIDTEAKS